MNNNIIPSSFTNPNSHPPKSTLPMLYYGLVVVATAAVVLIVYNFIIIRWCADRHGRPRQALAGSAMNSGESLSKNLPASFRFKAAAAAEEEEGGFGCECAVCLSVFEEGEEVRKLPRCTHMFHATCIDMWLYSHSDCPLCRAPVATGRACSSPAILFR